MGDDLKFGESVVALEQRRGHRAVAKGADDQETCSPGVIPGRCRLTRSRRTWGSEKAIGGGNEDLAEGLLKVPPAFWACR
jgi:hypothetical protein